jgi:hypothetical protein
MIPPSTKRLDTYGPKESSVEWKRMIEGVSLDTQREEASEVAATIDEFSFSFARVVSNVGSCTSSSQNRQLVQSVSHDEPQRKLPSRSVSTAVGSRMDEMDQELVQASKLLNRLAEDSKSESVFGGALESTKSRQEFVDGNTERSENTEEETKGIVATL